jgi:sugar phosphate isomerase/epimerase
MNKPSRRDLFILSTACCTSGMAESTGAAASSAKRGGFRYCLNTATLSGFRLSVSEQIRIAAQAGYQAVEPWLQDLQESATASLRDLRKRIEDLGLTVESVIAFPEWIVEDPVRRAHGLEQARRDMDVVARIGGKRIAIPPAGSDNTSVISLSRITERYRAVLALGDQMGVIPELEFWGGSPHLSRLSQAVYAAIETAHPKACVLADVFHLYKGGSGFRGLSWLSGQAIQVLHMNDYPAQPPRETIGDAERVYPGDGVAPLDQILTDLKRVAPDVVLSLELFNAAYWKGDPLATAQTGLAKMQAAVRRATDSSHSDSQVRMTSRPSLG